MLTSGKYQTFITQPGQTNGIIIAWFLSVPTALWFDDDDGLVDVHNAKPFSSLLIIFSYYSERIVTKR